MPDDPIQVKQPLGMGAPGLHVERRDLPGCQWLLTVTRLRKDRGNGSTVQQVLAGIALSNDERTALVDAVDGFAAVRALHKRAVEKVDADGYGLMVEQAYCAHCSDLPGSGGLSWLVSYPCPTLKAIGVTA